MRLYTQHSETHHAMRRGKPGTMVVIFSSVESAGVHRSMGTESLVYREGGLDGLSG